MEDMSRSGLIHADDDEFRHWANSFTLNILETGFFWSLCSFECAQSTNLKMYKRFLYNFLTSGTLNPLKFLLGAKVNFDCKYLGKRTLFL